MYRLYCSTLVAALLLGASLIADAGSAAPSDPLLAHAVATTDASSFDRDGYLLIATDAAGEVTGIDLVNSR